MYLFLICRGQNNDFQLSPLPNPRRTNPPRSPPARRNRVTFPHRHERPVPARQVSDFPPHPQHLCRRRTGADSVIANFATTAADGKTYQVEHFNLGVIISVGYRVKSHRGTQFRIWATQRLREYLVKGFTLDDERLKRGGGGNYFDELLARIRDIRFDVILMKTRIKQDNRHANHL